jgi:hypothetical protein
LNRLQVHYYLPNAIDLQDIFISKQRQQEAAKSSSGMQPQEQLLDDTWQYVLDAEPSVLPASSVCTSAAGVRDMLLTSNPAAAAEAAAAGSSSNMLWTKGGFAMEFDLSGCGAPEAEDEAQVTSRGVAGNFRAVHRAAKALGGVPEMLSAKDFAEHGPDERAVILYVAFLCGRLLECSKDDRAAHIIQTAWRQGKAKTAGERLKLVCIMQLTVQAHPQAALFKAADPFREANAAPACSFTAWHNTVICSMQVPLTTLFLY